ncbi:flagellar hook assembly protein FlgD [bacterium]|jgi:flagellar basal-body rod modification protein FlgD|nr:flagellar hook assembly protein FlgD [bacterium]
MVASLGKSENLMRAAVEGQDQVPASQAQGRDNKLGTSSTQFGDVYEQIQAKYGQKPEKPREIKKTLGKDDFLRLMLSQMKNQDPTSPFKAEQMATEIAQFTSVEQLQNMNQNLTKLSQQNRPLEQMVMTGMIGKTVTVDRDRFPHAEGENDSLSFNLSKDSKSTVISVNNEAGEEVYKKDLGPQKNGLVSFTWDGKKNNGLPAKSGNYAIRVEAIDHHEQKIQINSLAQAKVIGVSFEGQDPILLIGDSKHQQKISMRNIIRVESDPVSGSNSSLASSQSGIKPIESLSDQAPNFFTFKKGVGSVPVASEVAEKLQREFSGKGFPNGLSDSDQISDNDRKEVISNGQ